MDQAPWYVSAFDRGYLERYAHRGAAEALRQVAGLLAAGHLRRGERVLDLACGAGRHLRSLREHGLRPVGVDLSPDLLAPAREVAPVCRADMRALPLRGEAVDAVVQMFTAFGYFADDRENRRVLAEVARVLTPGGRHVLDLMNGTRTLAELVADSERRDERGRRVREQRRYDPRTHRIEKRIEVEDGDGVMLVRHESVRVLTLDEVRAWLAEAGLRHVAALGDWDGSPYEPASSPRMVVVSRR